MQLIDVETPLDFNLFDAGDRHEGARLHDSDGWQTFCEMARSPYMGCKTNHVVLKGDDMESILVDDQRFDFTSTESRALEQMEFVKRSTIPIKDLVRCWLTGNHELKLMKFGEITKRLAEDLKIPYGTYSSKITFRNKGKPFLKAFVTHGFGSISSVADDEVRRRANMQLSLKRRLARKAGDCAYMSMGHCHKLLAVEPSRTLFLTDDGRKLRQNYTEPPRGCNAFIPPELRWYGASGSFLRNQGIGFSGYGERFGYDPVELGFLVLVVRGGQIVALKEEKI